jgi:hypothetical protein
MTTIATALGHTVEATDFEAKAKHAAAVFLTAYPLRNGSFADGGPLPTQSAQALGLKLFDPATDAVLAPMLSDSARRGVQEVLLKAVVDRGHPRRHTVCTASQALSVRSSSSPCAPVPPPHCPLGPPPLRDAL